MTRKIYLIRHGETDWNKNARFQGQSDIPLNEQGRLQAAALAGRLKAALPLDYIVASDLSRARETAEILRRDCGVPLYTDAGLREIHFGRWEGLNEEAIRYRWPRELQEWFGSGLLSVPGGETQEQLLERVWGCFCQWANRTDYQSMAMVSHGGALGALITHIVGQPLTRMHQYLPKNTGITLIHVDEGDVYRLDDGPEWQ